MDLIAHPAPLVDRERLWADPVTQRHWTGMLAMIVELCVAGMAVGWACGHYGLRAHMGLMIWLGAPYEIDVASYLELVGAMAIVAFVRACSAYALGGSVVEVLLGFQVAGYRGNSATFRQLLLRYVTQHVVVMHLWFLIPWVGRRTSSLRDDMSRTMLVDR